MPWKPKLLSARRQVPVRAHAMDCVLAGLSKVAVAIDLRAFTAPVCTPNVRHHPLKVL